MARARNRLLTAALHPVLTRPLRRAVDAVLAEVGAPPSTIDTFDFAYRAFDTLFQMSVRELSTRAASSRTRSGSSVRSWPVPRRRPRPTCPRGGTTWTPTPRWCSSPRGPSTPSTSAGSSRRPCAPWRTRTSSSSRPRGGRPVDQLERALGTALPANARVATFLPYDQLLPRCSVVVTNGGFGGVQRALAHGVPLVVAGSTEDKPEVAARVAWAGCGRNLRSGTPRPRAIRRAVLEVLSTSTHRARSRQVAASIAALPDPVDVIEAGLAAAVAAATAGGTQRR
ncbi:hypothetical protein Q9Q99_01540 [Curtobacterium flaccumfaciens]|nr:hypothetical protein Q9Q99_01540 [Curtobacterium flaccumfaciens]